MRMELCIYNINIHLFIRKLVVKKGYTKDEREKKMKYVFIFNLRPLLCDII